MGTQGHRRWVRISHWTVAASFLTLAVTGILILMVHPRLYWGEVGNELTPALLEIPISNNYQPEKWERVAVYDNVPGSPISADRNYSLFNENGWGRSLHFLAAWVLVSAGAIYLLVGLIGGHVRRNIVPRTKELAPSALLDDARQHLHPTEPVGAGPPYGAVQKVAYAFVVFVALPLMLLTGLTMSPAITAAFPFLLDVFGGFQSARTVHFFTFAALLLFLVVHVAMVFVTGAGRQLRAMTWGK